VRCVGSVSQTAVDCSSMEQLSMSMHFEILSVLVLRKDMGGGE